MTDLNLTPMKMRSTNPRIVVLDTETTGLSPEQGHRIIEIGCVELVNRRLTGNRFHVYINPERVIDAGAVEVHGITNEFLEHKPRFAGVAEDFLAFVQGAELVIHNAPFDVGFINHEFALLGEPLAPITEYCQVFDTLAFARQKHPGQRNSLDALCKRYGVDNSQRELHGALLDAEILADVYLLMTGGQFSLLDEASEVQTATVVESAAIPRIAADRPRLKVITCGPEELEAHQQRLAAIEKAGGGCLWKG
jgi:DNA polymerase-3 subunit epsilon